MMNMISKNLTIKALLLSVVVLTALSSLAKTSETLADIQKTKKELQKLVKEANKYKHDSIDFYEAQINAIDEQDPELQKKAANIDKLKAESNRLMGDTARQNKRLAQLKQTILDAKNDKDLEEEVNGFVANLLNSQCNTMAIASLDKFDIFLNKSYFERFKKNRELLRKYPEYLPEMYLALDTVFYDLEDEGWSKQEEGSDILKVFDDQWKKVKYLKHLGKKGEKILFLDDIVQRVQDMRTLGFEDQKDEFKEIRELLKPLENPVSTPLDNLIAQKEQYDQLKTEVQAKEEKLTKINKDIFAIENLVNKTANDDAEFERLDKLISDHTDVWFAMRKVIDTRILDYCKLCLSEPADENGENYHFREMVEKELMGLAQSDATKKKVETYKVFFDNYWEYTQEIRQYLLDFKGLRSAQGSVTGEKKNAENALHKLSYWNYYSQRNNKDAVSIPHLDKILDTYMKWFNGNFGGVTAKQYGELGHQLMGTQSNNASKPKSTPTVTDDEQTETLPNEIGDKPENDDKKSFEEDTEAKKAKEKAEEEAQKAQEKALKEEQEAREKAEKEAKKAQEKAEKEEQELREKVLKEAKETQKAQEKAEKEAQKAKEKAEKEAEKEAEKARKKAEKAQKEAEKAQKEAEEAQKKAEKARQKAENEDSNEGTSITPLN